MAPIAVTILDPNNNRSAHLVETRIPIRELMLPIIQQLKLPERPTYQLFRLGSGDLLPGDKSLGECGVPAGAELLLKPVRNQILKEVLDEYYEEAQGYVNAQEWQMAKEKLAEIFRLDPTYPDIQGLERAIASRVGALRSQPATSEGTARRPAAASTVPPPLPAGVSRAYQLFPEPVKRSGVNWTVIAWAIAGVIIVAIIAVVVVALFFPGLLNFSDLLNGLLQRSGIPFPGLANVGRGNVGSGNVGSGDVRVTLRWQGHANLNLHVTDPNGEAIWFGKAQSTSGGILDVDANGACEGFAQPVEIVDWPSGTAPSGTYEVRVIYFEACDNRTPVDYEVTITLDGNVADVIHAQMNSEGEEHPVTNFQY
jgi:hypothetical protein